MRFPLAVLPFVIPANAFPILASHPVSFACEVRHLNTYLGNNAEECQAACLSVCSSAGNGKKLFGCLWTLRNAGYGDCIYALRQTIRPEARLCPSSEDNALLVALPRFEGGGAPPRTTIPKAVTLTLDFTEPFCGSKIDPSLTLEWLVPSAVPPEEVVPAVADSAMTNSSRGFCNEPDFSSAAPVTIPESEIQQSGSTLSLDLLSWGQATWRTIGFNDTYLLIRSHSADCAFKLNAVTGGVFSLSQFGTVRVAQSAVPPHFLLPSIVMVVGIILVM
eukprot:Protomagalhaensia_wolfi_Nauph_80__6297@NODE_96_length_3755_cov_220_282831_g73_i0_p3_GENE_NODE_96_length_3755_cov_220_282831_g73_i0NODE_96_length_3755_cov_220_282831_g73_i0_p3_ORF_typecomplete_len276_score24_55ApoO/PF09769_9/5e02ApoO/PF09769_9/0_88PAN_2/PF08276_11/0_75PAN_2/PF08276_11/6_1e03_NODE_96_length_3755_cov_220_282831_g73_i028013628